MTEGAFTFGGWRLPLELQVLAIELPQGTLRVRVLGGKHLLVRGACEEAGGPLFIPLLTFLQGSRATLIEA